MKILKKYVAIATVVVCAVVMLCGVLVRPVWAQVRAALTRDIDTPALAPFRASMDIGVCCLFDERLLTTVPPGKRLVIEYISYQSLGGTGQMVAALLRNGQSGPPVVYFEVHPPHASLVAGSPIQDGSMPVKAYFESGEEVWVGASHTDNGSRHFNVTVSGYYVTP